MSKRYKRRVISLFLNFLIFCGAAIIYYIIFSIFFETPIQYEINKNNTTLKKQYEIMSAKLDTISLVLDNLSQRDKSIYEKFFEAQPYKEKIDTMDVIGDDTELLRNLTNNELAELFFNKIEQIESDVTSGSEGFAGLQSRMEKMGDKSNQFPSIQPIVNKDFSKLAASFGMKIQPFLKTISMHNGIDYAIPEETRIFATADGKVTSSGQGSKGEGLTVEITHNNGYTTIYSHLNKSLVRRGQIVRRGDIIAYSGNSGLSFLPHLHYSVKYKGEFVDPINFLFYELDPYQTIQIEKIAKNAMQSLD